MKRGIAGCALTIVIIILSGCGKPRASPVPIPEQVVKISATTTLPVNAPTQAFLRAETTRMRVKKFLSASERAGCDADVTYPHVTGGLDVQVAKKINKTIEDAVVQTFQHDNVFHQGTSSTTLGSAIDAYLTACVKNMRHRMKFDPGYSFDWVLDLDGRATLNDKNLLSVELFLGDEFGGAHPISWVTLLNFDVRTGKPVTFEDLFKPESLPDFYRLENQTLVDQHPHAVYADGYKKMLEKGEVFPPHIFYLTPDSLITLYQDYEIAGHGDGGVQEAKIRYASFKDFLKSDSPLQNFVSP